MTVGSLGDWLVQLYIHLPGIVMGKNSENTDPDLTRVGLCSSRWLAHPVLAMCQGAPRCRAHGTQVHVPRGRA